MHLILFLFLNLAHANFGASQDEMDLFDLGNGFINLNVSCTFLGDFYAKNLVRRQILNR